MIGPPSGTWVEVWRDDFDGPAGSAPSAANWSVSTVASPPNGELEYYTARRENSFLDGNGHLVIRAIQEAFMGKSYTSARLDTARACASTSTDASKRSFRVPRGQGLLARVLAPRLERTLARVRRNGRDGARGSQRRWSAAACTARISSGEAPSP